MHTLAPVVSELYEPAAHAEHTADVGAPATAPYVPATQPVHTCVVVACLTSLYMPAPHMAHALGPVVSELNEPAAHAVHAAEVGEPVTAP